MTSPFERPLAEADPEIASLIRQDPEEARQVIYKLSKILRRLLRQQENLTPLREELSFIDAYLAIEMVRFGEKLRFVRDIDPATLDLLVPSMLLQPLVENSIRHGLSSKIDGGTIHVRSRLLDGRLQILVEDDGVGQGAPSTASVTVPVGAATPLPEKPVTLSRTVLEGP